MDTFSSWGNFLKACGINGLRITLIHYMLTYVHYECTTTFNNSASLFITKMDKSSFCHSLHVMYCQVARSSTVAPFCCKILLPYFLKSYSKCEDGGRWVPGETADTDFRSALLLLAAALWFYWKCHCHGCFCPSWIPVPLAPLPPPLILERNVC